MKYLRMLVAFVVVIVFIVPMNALVTISAEEDQYRKFKHETQDRILEKLRAWAYGRQFQEKTFNKPGIFTA